MPDPVSPAASPPLTVTLAAWAGWRDAPGGPREAGWSAVPADGQAVPVLLRRRIDRAGQAALRLAWNMAASGAARIVASSRHGAFIRSVAIMRAAQAGEPASPAEFSLSVHHAMAGLLSIARANRAGHTAVAAGAESLAAGLLEAAAGLGLAESGQAGALLMHLDEPLPVPFDVLLPAAPACALVLALMPDGPGQKLEIRLEPRAAGDGAAGEDIETQLWRFLAAPDCPEAVVGQGRLALRLRRAG